MAKRTYFYKSSRLIKKGLVRLDKCHSANDLTEFAVRIDRRVLDCLVGLDEESTQVSESANLYELTTN